MANIKSAKKRIIQSKKRRFNNNCRRSILRTFMKKVNHAILHGNKEEAEKMFKKTQSIIDRYSKNRKIIHKNKAARYKSNLIMKIKSM
ncbi:MAG: 30S ribosomal protein S20 [Arsenophonus sp.]|nr:MAG: 30S ribosomal protein S20 [Arsenophonus sp.]